MGTVTMFDLPRLAAPPAWHLDAACAEYGDRADWWFPERGASTKEAKTICARCLVRAECLEFALGFVGWLPGIWGGTSEVERRRLRAQPADERAIA